MAYDINSQQVDIENLFKQNANDLSSIKELYRKLKDLEEKITQIKYVDSKLTEKLKSEYENLKRVILDENIQVELSNDINKINISINKFNNDINEVSSQLDTNIRLGYEKTLFDNMKDRFESKYVNVKDFGAKGDGITDDTSTIKNAITYCEENQIDLFFPKGNYLVKSTLYINIEKLTIYGIAGETTIIINDDFVGNVLIYLYAKNGTWDYRNKRIRTLGNMNLINKGNNEVTGIRTSGEINTDYEGHVDRITVKNMMIRDFEVGILYGSHSYAFIFEKIYTPYCNYCIKSETNQDDSGEIPVFRNCFFC